MEDGAVKKTLSRTTLIVMARTIGGVMVFAGLLPFVAAFTTPDTHSDAFRNVLAACCVISFSQTLARGGAIILEAEEFADEQIAEHEDD